jgi:hypothetical protein
MRSCILFLLSAFLVPGMVAAQDQPRKLKPVMVWTGSDSNQSQESFNRCETQKDWEAIWLKHCGPDWRPFPQIDFDAYMIIVIFTKEGGSDRGITVKEVSEEKAHVRLRYWLMTYQVASGNFAPPGQEKTGPVEAPFQKEVARSYLFVILPKSPKAIVFEEDIRNLISGPPVWKERARLPAVKRP